MPVTYSIESEGRLIRTVCHSPLRFADVMEHFRTLNSDPACVGVLDVLLDVSDADALPDTSQLNSVSAVIGGLAKKVRFGACAIVAARDAMFGMMRVFEAFSSDYFRVVRVFRDTREAELWLISEKKAMVGSDTLSQA